MIILTIKTDNPQAELGLYDGDNRLASVVWQAHRELAETIHLKIEQLLKSQQKDWQAIGGIVCFAGPGSFTGLRIGLSVGNATAYGLSAPVVSAKGDTWIQTGIKRILAGEADPLALPEYGGEAHITTPRQA
jgi:tRNA threonylcarbamoyladenosine biosynthesis protein TsaB